MIVDEARIVAERINGQMATLGVIIQAASATTSMGAKRETLTHFQKLIKGLGGD